MATIRMAQSRQETQEFSLENLYSVAVNATHVIFPPCSERAENGGLLLWLSKEL